jgi:cell division septum initiation protein DivIVA
MTSNDPEQLRREIEGTQRELSVDVDALTEKVTPGRIVERRIDRARRSIDKVKGQVMGTVSNGPVAASDKIGSTASSVVKDASSIASSAGDTAGQVPEVIRRGADGNPLAAGMIAFGAGWLVASLLPASKTERKVAGQATDLVHEQAQPVAQKAGHIAEQLKDNLREPAQQAVESVKSAAGDAASTLSAEAQSAAENVTERGQDAKDTIRGESGSSG